MDSREAPPQPQPNMLMGPTSYSTNAMIPQPSSAPRFHFNSLAPPPHSPPSQSQLQQQPHSKPIDSLAFDGSPSFGGAGSFGIDPNKKKRGRPRKYTPDGNIASNMTLRLATTPSPSPASHANSSAGAPANSASDQPAKRNRGRPPGSGKKQLDALGGVGGSGFTPHVISVKAGEDIGSKIATFSQQGPRTVCILSANGAVCNVTLRQPAMTGGTVTYEGRFEIISLAGSFPIFENNGVRRNSGLSVSLAGPDGRVLGGGVVGVLMAASPVQIILGSFLAEGKKSSSNILQQPGGSSTPIPHMLSFGAPMTSSPPSQGGGSSESSDDNGSSPSPLNRTGLYNNASQQPLHNMQMYQLWSGQTPQ
ncbi:hypothetical protein Q3G72_000007 [Acer saccharum]|nr:hypothetical protein Q3G72_000007 [Acer saccharum]